jgi:hypothetical protein
MGLDIREIRELITKPRHRDSINKAVAHQNRVKFHAQTVLSPCLGQPTADFLSFVSNLIPEDKFKIFKTLFRYPLKTNEVTGVCFDKLSRIFDGRNPAFNYQFSDRYFSVDWEYYRKERLNEPEVWQSKGWENYKTEINSVLIVDLPREQSSTDPLPEPYFYWLPIDSVISFEADRDSGVMDWIIFNQDADTIAVIDNERYRVFRKQAGGNIGELLVDSPHDLGYCPARFFWDEPVNMRDPFVKASPITKELESLDWYLFYHLSKRHLDMYGSYPIYSGYEQSCDFSNEENGDYCDGGFLKNKEGYYLFDSAGLLMRCPKCGNKRIAGVGSFVEIPVPSDTQPDLRNPVQILTVDRDSLDYNVAEEERLRTDIITAVVGTNEEITTRDALNEQQIRANFESQSTILNRVKKGFEAAQKFVDETVCRLRYGNAFISASVNYGTEFFLYDATELREQYKKAKDSGSSEAELDALQNKIIESEYRNDKLQQSRMMVLSDLEPYRSISREEALNLYDRGFMSEEDLGVKLNFGSLIRRFERENTNIVDFGSAIDYDRKIDIISNRLREYVSQDRDRGNTGR